MYKNIAYKSSYSSGSFDTIPVLLPTKALHDIFDESCGSCFQDTVETVFEKSQNETTCAIL